jgi:ElaB/YqjD/DUF883 family membrane-anchored ribosome-binding protein
MTRTNDHKAHSVAADLKENAAQVGQQLRDMGGQVKDAAKEQYNNLRDKAADYYTHGKETVEEYTDTVEQYIQDKPIKAVLIAAGIGMVIGYLWRRS